MKQTSLNAKVVDKIIKLRKDLHLSQEKTAELANMSKSTYVRLEEGQHAITLDEAVKLSDILKTEFNQLVDMGLSFTNTGNKTVYNQGNIIIYNIGKDDLDEINPDMKD